MARLDWTRDGADWPNRAASRFVEAGGLRWHVQVMGDGPALLALHGAGASSHSWRALAPDLARDFTVIAPDAPGHGFTSAPRRGAAGLPATAAATGALMRALGVAPRVIVGHSAGAAIGAQMALDGQADPALIVSFNGAFLPFKGAAEIAFPAMAKLLNANPLAPRLVAMGADSAAVRMLMRGVGSEIDPEGRALYRRLIANPGHVAGALGMMAAWKLRPLGRALGGLKPHLELIVGEADRVVPPSDAEIVAARAPRARLIRLPGLGHLAHEEDPAQAARLIRDAASEFAS